MPSGPDATWVMLVAGLGVAFLQHTAIEAGSPVTDQQGSHGRLVHADAHPITGDAGLRDLEQGATDPVAVPDANLRIGQTLDGEILSELPVFEAGPTQFFLPKPVGFDLVDQHRPVFAAVTGQVPLSVAVDVQASHHPPALDRRLPNSGMNDLPLPWNVARQANVDRKQTWHHINPRIEEYVIEGTQENSTRIETWLEIVSVLENEVRSLQQRIATVPQRSQWRYSTWATLEGRPAKHCALCCSVV